MARRQKKLKPAGHSAVIETLIQPAIVIASTLMSAIAAYVLAYDEINRLLADRGNWQDGFVVALCIGMGFLIDMAIIVSATRYKMHAIRADPRETRWLSLAKWVLIIGLISETMTLFYFFVRIDSAAYPVWLVWLASLVHAFLVSARAFLPPVVIAYFAAGVLPVAFDRADRNREIKARTSSNIMVLIDRLSVVQDTDDKSEMLRALGGQLVLDTYATYDETARTSEDEQLHRDGKLLAHMARMHGLDWSALGADVAPELLAVATRARPDTPPAGGPDGAGNGGAPSRLNSAAKRAALQRDMLTARSYDLDADDADGGWSARNDGGADDGSPDDEFDMTWDDGEITRTSHPTRPRSGRAPTARLSTLARELVTDLPTGKSEHAGDTPEAKRVMRYLDRHPGAKIADVISGAKVGRSTARRYYTAWLERNKRQEPAPFTEEMEAVTPAMLSNG